MSDYILSFKSDSCEALCKGFVIPIPLLLVSLYLIASDFLHFAFYFMD